MTSRFPMLKKLKENKKGSLAIEIVTGMLMMLLIVSFLMDILTLTWRFHVVSTDNYYLARTASVQGGIETLAPDGYQGAINKGRDPKDAYDIATEVRTKIDNDFSNAGIASGDYEIYVNGINITRTGGTGEIDYLKPIETEIRVKYKWSMVSNFIPGQIDNWLSSKRSSKSEFKHRYDDWKDE